MGGDRHVVTLEEGNEVAARAVVLASGAEYNRLPVDCLDQYEGITAFYAAGPHEGQLCGGERVAVVGGGNSAGQAAVWLARGGALVTLLHRRADLRETMSQYLIEELDHFGVAVRDRSEICKLEGEEGRLESVKLTDGDTLPLSYLFFFLGASPCTGWLGDTVARDSKGFILTGADAGVPGLLETSVPGIYAAGDVRAGFAEALRDRRGRGRRRGALRARPRRRRPRCRRPERLRSARLAGCRDPSRRRGRARSAFGARVRGADAPPGGRGAGSRLPLVGLVVGVRRLRVGGRVPAGGRGRVPAAG